MSYPRSTHYLTALLRRELPHLRAWPAQHALAWVQWHCNHGLALVVRNGWRIRSAVLVRRIKDRTEADEYYAHHEDGPVAYIDACVARDRGGMKPLFSLFYIVLGHACTHMAWARLKYANRATLVPMRDAIRRLTYV